ncbi:MAG TPA: hypothetical protein VHP11_02790 [Tepidisphaeraceae bacterium]|nr:hypothetical protein [Tepidisphaeraceae bacterium]
MSEPKDEKERLKRVGDDLEDEPDAVDIKQLGEEELGGANIEETWHRTGSKPPKAEAEKPAPPSESSEQQP